MTVLVVSPLYLALAAIVLLLLSVRIIFLRKKFRVLLGDNNEPSLKKAIRAQGNFIEYVPLALILLVVLELSGGSALCLHLAGGSLLTGRLIHAWSLSQLKEPLILRQWGMALTFFSVMLSALLLLSKQIGFA